MTQIGRGPRHGGGRGPRALACVRQGIDPFEALFNRLGQGEGVETGALALQPQPAAFGGGDGTRDPLVMDATDVIVLR